MSEAVILSQAKDPLDGIERRKMILRFAQDDWFCRGSSPAGVGGREGPGMTSLSISETMTDPVVPGLRKTPYLRGLPAFVLGLVLAAPSALAQEFCSPALYYLSRGDYARAQKESRGDEGTVASRLNIRGVAEMMSGRQREATATLRAALESDPGYLPARLNLGIALYQQKLLAEAAAELERVFQNESAFKGNAAYHRGLVAIGSDDPRSALVWLQRALEFDPGLADAYLQIGQVHEQLGELQLAGRSYRSYLEHHPESPTGLLRFGIAAQRAGHIETARRYLRLVIDVAPDSAEAVEARKFFVIWD